MPFILNLMVACLAAFGLSVVAGVIVVRLEERSAVSQLSNKRTSPPRPAHDFRAARGQSNTTPRFEPEEHRHVA
jgi:hypothetical protein